MPAPLPTPAPFSDTVNLKNKANQIAQVLGDLNFDSATKDRDTEKVGGNAHVGDGEFRALIGNTVDYSWIDRNGDGLVDDGDTYNNDAYALLSEMLTGDGIAGVELVGLDGDSFTLMVDGLGDSVDFLVFEGQAAVQAIALVDQEQGKTAGGSGFDLRLDSTSQFAILDLDDAQPQLKIGNFGELNQDGSLDVGPTLKGGEVPAIMEQVLQAGGYSGVNVIDVDKDSVTLSFDGLNGAKDTLLIKGVDFSDVEDKRLNALDNKNDDFVFLSSDGAVNVDGWVGSIILDDVINDLGDGDMFDYGDKNDAFIKNSDGADILDFLVDQGGAVTVADETLSLIGVDSENMTVALENTTTGTTDYLVFDFMTYEIA